MDADATVAPDLLPARLGLVVLMALAALAIVAMGRPAEVAALPNFLSDFNTQYGTDGSRIDDCVVCHVSGSTNRNPYGQDWKENGMSFAAVEALDSDGDGWANIAEITARTFPGDPADHPVAATCNGLSATITGTPGNDVLVGTAGADVIVGLGGNDVIKGLGGNDTICGDAGTDKIYPGPGVDWVDGGKGTRDWVYYGGAKRRVAVSLATGTATGQGKDTLAAVENIQGSKFDDRLVGKAGANVIRGIAGNDLLIGKGGADTLVGGPGNDEARGGPGADTCTAETTSSC